MIEMERRSIKINDTGDRQYIALGEKGGERNLTIVIGYNEAQAIDRFVKGREMPRPMTHDLLASLIEATGSELERVEVVDLREGTFYAEIGLIQQNGTPTRVDARPSDAIALATALGRPVFVAEDVLRDANIM